MSDCIQLAPAAALFGLPDDALFAALTSERQKYGLPPLPPDQIQAKYNGRSGSEVIRVAVPIYNAFLAGAAALGFTHRADSWLVDFGCGWGRFSQIAQRDFRQDRIIGVDISKEAIGYYEAGRCGIPVHVDQWPPCALLSRSVNIVISNSVFSHLSEELHWEWVRELHRVLMDGGVLAVTTRAREFVEFVRKFKADHPDRSKVPPHAAALVNTFSDADEALRRYDAGEFVFDAGAGRHELGATFGEACIPRTYVERHWSKLFSQVSFMDVNDRPGLEQAIIIARK